MNMSMQTRTGRCGLVLLCSQLVKHQQDGCGSAASDLYPSVWTSVIIYLLRSSSNVATDWSVTARSFLHSRLSST